MTENSKRVMTPNGSLADRTSAVMFPESRDVLKVYMVIVSVARNIIHAEKCIFYHLDSSHDITDRKASYDYGEG